VLGLSIIVRALHQIGAAVFLTTYLLKDKFSLPPLYLYLVFASGFILVCTEWMRHRQVFREVSGIATILKVLLLGAAFHQFLPPNSTVVFTFLLASVCSHAPKNIRHKLIY
jgi:NhaP-type Na+/H+ or K+/H+ antiporter